MGICCMTQGASTGTLSQPRGLGWGGRREGDSQGRNQHNTVKELSFN